jgi:hypothetical protein
MRDSRTIVALTKGTLDEGSWDAVCRSARRGRNVYLLNHGNDVEIVNPPPTLDDELSMVFTRLSIRAANDDPPPVVEASGPISKWDDPLLASGYTDEPMEEDIEEILGDFMRGQRKPYDELEEIEREDQLAGRDTSKVVQVAESIFRHTLNMFLLQERVFSPDTVDLWGRLNRAASLDRSPAPPLTPPLQYALGVPVFMHLFYSALPKTRFVEVPSAIILLRKMAEVCEVCGSPACRQGDPLVCEEEQREWLRHTKMFHGENLTPRPDNHDSAKYDNLRFHINVLRCHPGSVFYFTFPSPSLINERMALRLCVICGLCHATYSVEACISKMIEARDVASRMFFRRDVWNAAQVEEFRKEEEENEPTDGPREMEIEVEEREKDKWTTTEDHPEPDPNSRDPRITRMEDLLKGRARELEKEELRVEE